SCANSWFERKNESGSAGTALSNAAEQRRGIPFRSDSSLRIEEPTMFENADLIHRYTRAEAIRDGVLIDVSAVARQAGIRYPVALTRAAWEHVSAPIPATAYRNSNPAASRSAALQSLARCSRDAQSSAAAK